MKRSYNRPRLDDDQLADRERVMDAIARGVKDGHTWVGRPGGELIRELALFIKLSTEVDNERGKRAVHRAYRVGFTHGFIATAAVVALVTILIAVLS